MSKLTRINMFFSLHWLEPLNEEHYHLIDDICNILDGHVNDTDNDVLLTIIGDYYQFDKKNYGEAKRYYMMAVEKGNTDAMCKLARYYAVHELNDDEMKKYYKMAVEKGNVLAMYKLAGYYNHCEREYNEDEEEMKKYYTMAIERGYVCAMEQLGLYYMVRKNYVEMEKYFRMAIDSDDKYIMLFPSLVKYYFKNNNHEGIVKYCLIALNINRDYVSYAVRCLEPYITYGHVSLVIKYLIELNMDFKVLTERGVTVDDLYVKMYDLTKENIELKKQILELQLRPPELGGPIYEDAKKDFILLSH